MCSIFVGVHIKNKPSDIVPLKNVQFNNSVGYLKEEIAKQLNYEGQHTLDVIYLGNALDDDVKLCDVLKPNATVHCFERFHTNKVYQSDPLMICAESAQELFNVIAHIQISVNSRINILQKILTEYPEFRRNLGAQALIRDSVLFNTLSQAEVAQKIAKHYPLICEAAAFIVDTVKKELTHYSASTNFSEPATDSTNSSEEENSLGATSGGAANESATGSRSENSHIRMISRQQLQAALAQIGAGSHNSLSNIAQRNVDSDGVSTTSTTAASTTAAMSAPLATSASGERITSELFRTELQRALNALQSTPSSANTDAATAAAIAAAAGAVRDVDESMDTSETPANDENAMLIQQDSITDGAGDLSDIGNEMPSRYRSHQYAEQLRTMAQMGFVDFEENLTYLNLTNGNIENAIHLLVGSLT